MARGASLKRGEIWWARLPPPDRTRPVVLVSRQEAYAVGAHVIVAPVTTRVRRIATHVDVGEREGLPRNGAVNCGLLLTLTPDDLIEPLGELGMTKLAELDDALKFALGLE